MDVSAIVSAEYVEVDVDTRLGKVRARFEEDNPKGIVVTRDGEYQGLLGERELLQSHVEDDAKVGSLIKASRNDPSPKLGRNEGVREVARKLIESGTHVAPVFEDGEVVGIVSADGILRAVLENLDALTVEDIYTSEVVTIGEDDGVGKAINRLREHGVSRLPVLNENGYLTGIVTTHDIHDFAVRNMNKLQQGDRSGESDRMLDIPVYDVMQGPVETTTVDTSVEDAVSTMLEHDYGGLVVTPAEDDRLVKGVLTKTDVLRALTYTEEQHLDVQITKIDLLDTLSRQDVREAIESVADKYQKMQVQHAHVRFHEHREQLRGTPLIQCQIRLRTNKGQVAGTGEGYGARNAFHVALDKLERNVLEVKGITRDAEQKGNLLRKLGGL